MKTFKIYAAKEAYYSVEISARNLQEAMQLAGGMTPEEYTEGPGAVWRMLDPEYQEEIA